MTQVSWKAQHATGKDPQQHVNSHPSGSAHRRPSQRRKAEAFPAVVSLQAVLVQVVLARAPLPAAASVREGRAVHKPPRTEGRASSLPLEPQPSLPGDSFPAHPGGSRPQPDYTQIPHPAWPSAGCGWEAQWSARAHRLMGESGTPVGAPDAPHPTHTCCPRHPGPHHTLRSACLWVRPSAPSLTPRSRPAACLSPVARGGFGTWSLPRGVG